MRPLFLRNAETRTLWKIMTSIMRRDKMEVTRNVCEYDVRSDCRHVMWCEGDSTMKMVLKENTFNL